MFPQDRVHCLHKTHKWWFYYCSCCCYLTTLKGKVTEREWKIFIPLVHSPNSHKQPGWAKPQPECKNSSRAFRVGSRGTGTWTISCCLPSTLAGRRVGSGAAGLELVLTWNLIMRGSSYPAAPWCWPQMKVLRPRSLDGTLLPFLPAASSMREVSGLDWVITKLSQKDLHASPGPGTKLGIVMIAHV